MKRKAEQMTAEDHRALFDTAFSAFVAKDVAAAENACKQLPHNYQDAHGRNVVHLLCQFPDSVASTTVLSMAPGDVNQIDYRGYTPLWTLLAATHTAVSIQVELAKMLIQQGANVAHHNGNKSLVEFAASKGNVPVLQVLLGISDIPAQQHVNQSDIPFFFTKVEVEDLVRSDLHEEILFDLLDASDNGNHVATYSAGLIYHAIGDAEKAGEAFLAAADLGVAASFVPAALYCLFHHQGDGGEADDEHHPYFVQAVRYLQAMVKRGDPSAHFWMGHCLYHGTGVPMNHEMALSYYTMAAALGHFRAGIEVAFLLAYDERDVLVSTDLIDSEIMPRLSMPLKMPRVVVDGQVRMPVLMPGPDLSEGVVADAIPPRVVTVHVHFLNHDGSLSTEYHPLNVPEQWVQRAAPVFKITLTRLKVRQLLGGLAPAGLDAAMKLVLNPPGNMDNEHEEYFWVEDCDDAMHDAFMLILNAVAASPAVTAPA